MVKQSSSQGSWVHNQGHLRSCQVSHQSGEKREKKEPAQAKSLGIALVERFLMAFLYLQNYWFSFLRVHNERQIWKSSPDIFHCPRAFWCGWEIGVNNSLRQDTAFTELPVTKAAQRHLCCPDAGSSLDWGSLHPFVLALPENLLSLQPAATHFQAAAREHCRAFISVGGNAFRSHLSGNLNSLSCFHTIYGVFSLIQLILD